MALVTLSLELTPAVVIGVALTDPMQPTMALAPVGAPIAVQVLPYYKGEPGIGEVVGDPVAYYILAKN